MQELKLVIRGIDQLSKPLAKISSVTDKFDSQVNALSERFANLRLQASKTAEFAKLDNSLKSNTAELDGVRRRLYGVRDEMRNTEKPTASLRNELKRLSIRENALSEKQVELRRKMVPLRQELKGLGIDSKNTTSAMDKLNRKFEEQKRVMEKVEKARQEYAKASQKFDRTLDRAAKASVVAATTAMAGRKALGILGAPLRETISFESSMADVKKVVDFETPDQLKEFEKRILDMTKYIPIAKEGLAEIAAAGGQLGVEREYLPGFIETTAKMSTAFDMLPNEAGEMAAKLSNIYDIPIEKMGTLGDAVNHLSDNTAAKASEIVKVMQRVGAVSKDFGLLPTQTAALANSFIALGKSPETAGTAINSMLLKLKTANTKGGKFADALQKVGFSTAQMTDMINEDAQGALTTFLESLEKMDGQARTEALTDIFNMEYADDVSLLAGSLDKYRHALSLVAEESNYASSMEKEFQNRSNTTANRIQLMHQSWEALQVKLGEKLIPAIERIIPAVEWAADKIGALIDKFPGVASGGMLLAGGLGAIAVIVGPVIMGAYGLATALAWLRKKMAATALSATLYDPVGGTGRGKGRRGKRGFFGKGQKIAGGAMGKLGRVTGKIPKLGKVGMAGLALGALEVGSILTDSEKSAGQKAKETTAIAAGMGGAWGGAKAGGMLGASIGTFLAPGIGTAIGGALGGIVGGGLGYWGGSELGEAVTSLFSDDNDGKDTEAGNVPVVNPVPADPTTEMTQTIIDPVPQISYPLPQNTIDSPTPTALWNSGNAKAAELLAIARENRQSGFTQNKSITFNGGLNVTVQAENGQVPRENLIAASDELYRNFAERMKRDDEFDSLYLAGA